MRFLTTIKETGSKFVVAENFRFSDNYVKAKELIDNGSIGKPVVFRWESIFLLEKENEYANTGWRQTPQYDGGYFTDGGIHCIDAIRYLFGEAEKVCG